MPQFKTLVDTSLLKEPKKTSAAIVSIPKGTIYSGEQDGSFVKTRIPAISPEEGFIRITGVSEGLQIPEPLASTDFGNFCALVTWAASEVGADRD